MLPPDEAPAPDALPSDEMPGEDALPSNEMPGEDALPSDETPGEPGEDALPSDETPALKLGEADAKRVSKNLSEDVENLPNVDALPLPSDETPGEPGEDALPSDETPALKLGEADAKRVSKNLSEDVENLPNVDALPLPSDETPGEPGEDALPSDETPALKLGEVDAKRVSKNLSEDVQNLPNVAKNFVSQEVNHHLDQVPEEYHQQLLQLPDLVHDVLQEAVNEYLNAP